MTNKNISFVVTMNYENVEGGAVCEQSARDNLNAAIERERANGGLTPHDISATELNVTVLSQATRKECHAEEAIAILIDAVMGNDGVTIEDFVNDIAEVECSYMEDSLWSVEGKLLDSQDIKGLIKQELNSIEGEALVATFEKWTDNSLNFNVKYHGDSVFSFTSTSSVLLSAAD